MYLKQFSFSYNYYYSIFFSRLFLSSSSSYILFLNSGYEYWILLYSTSIYTIFLETRICMLVQVTKRVREGERGRTEQHDLPRGRSFDRGIFPEGKRISSSGGGARGKVVQRQYQQATTNWAEKNIGRAINQAYCIPKIARWLKVITLAKVIPQLSKLKQ